MSKREYQVTIPIAGHAYVTVEAESEEQAKEMAFDAVDKNHIEEWEALDAFNQGNVCYCPQPWRITVEDMGEAED